MKAIIGGASALILLLAMLCMGVVGFFFGGDDPATCMATGATAALPSAHPSLNTPPSIRTASATWNAEQVHNAATIIDVGIRMGVPVRGWVIAVATAMQESALVNLPNLGHANDHDSLGLFQQRPSQRWGTADQIMNPEYASTTFYQHLLAIAGWQKMPLTQAAQAVQRSAFPDAYATWEPDATQIVSALTGISGGLAACAAAVSAQGWTQPVHGQIGSGFRTADRPTHDGVDLIVAKGTPIHAASAGTVTVVRCNAIDVTTGGDWGCDRDGDSNLTRGCGWYVDIEHPAGPAGMIVTRYCHMLTHPTVGEGQKVNAGDIIGISGSSGNSSGPHLHFEVHLGDHTSTTATDPVPFMASVSAPLGQ